MRVPGMTMDEIGLNPKSVEGEAPLNRTEDRLQGFWASVIHLFELKSSHMNVRVHRILITKTPNFHGEEFGQFLAQVFHMNTGPTITMGGYSLLNINTFILKFLSLIQLVKNKDPNCRASGHLKETI